MTQKTAEKAKAKLAKNGQPEIPKTLTHSSSQQIGDLLNIYKAQISQAVPKHVTPERIIQLCTTVIARTPKIKDCELATTIGAVMQASILGLDVTPQFGQCFFIPRKNGKTGKIDCTFLVGYKGYLQLMRRSGEVSTVFAHAVRENDFFEYELGLEPTLKHRPAEASRGEMTHAYAVLKFKDGGYIFEVLNRAEVMKAKARSQAGSSKYSPWNTEDEESMWRKTAIRRLSNYAPLSAEFISATVADGVKLTPAMFDQQTKQVDPMKIEPEDVQYTVSTETAQQEADERGSSGNGKKGVEKKTASADPWLEEAEKVKTAIIRMSDNERYLKEIGSLGYENIAQVPNDKAVQDKFMNALYAVAAELAKKQNAELDLK